MKLDNDTKNLIGAAVVGLVALAVGGYLWYRIFKVAFA